MVMVMNLEEFETLHRNNIDETLNQLQTAILLEAQLQAILADVSRDLRNFSQTVEEFIAEQKSE